MEAKQMIAYLVRQGWTLSQIKVFAWAVMVVSAVLIVLLLVWHVREVRRYRKENANEKVRADGKHQGC